MQTNEDEEMKQFEVGKTYETAVERFYDDVGLHRIGQSFTCHQVDADGDCWTTDLKFRGRPGLCCCAPGESLVSGCIVEVTP